MLDGIAVLDTLAVGTRVIYPCRGPCCIERIITQVVDGKATLFYHMVALDQSGGDLFVPVEKARVIGIRMLLEKSEIPNLLAQLEGASHAATDWKQRALDNLKLLTSGSAFDLAEVVKSLTELSSAKALSPTERRTLERARTLLICEISEVTGEPIALAEEQVDAALRAGKNSRAPLEAPVRPHGST